MYQQILAGADISKTSINSGDELTTEHTPKAHESIKIETSIKRKNNSIGSEDNASLHATHGRIPLNLHDAQLLMT